MILPSRGFSGFRLRDWREPRDWSRPWFDPPGWWPCCCGGGCNGAYTCWGGYDGTTGGPFFGIQNQNARYEIDTWTAKAVYPTHISNGSAQTINCKGYGIFGNKGVSPFFVQDVQEYVPDVWTTRNSSPLAARTDNASYAIGDSNGYVTGGGTLANQATNDHGQYTPDGSGGTWATKATLTGSATSTLRGAPIDDKGYVYTGYIPPVTGSNRTAEYDPVGDSWATKANRPAPLVEYAGAWPLNGRAYSMGGQPVTKTVQYYTVNTWTTAANLIVEKTYFGFASFDPSVGYISGGMNNTGVRVKTHYEYVINTWTNRANKIGVTVNHERSFFA